MRKENTNKKVNKKNSNFKAYIRNFLLFVDKKLIKTMGVLFVIAVLLIAISITAVTDAVAMQECAGTCSDNTTILQEYWSKFKILFITGVAGIVPYVYAPVIGFAGYLFEELVSIAYIIKGYGYLAGIGLGIIPLIINVVIICIVTSLGIYICKTVSVGYRISSIRNMNFTNFRIRLYEVLQKQDKVEKLTKARDVKIEKLENKKEKLNYLQILNVSLVVCVLQLISVIIQQIIM